MNFIENLGSILIFINFLYYVRPDDCTSISNFIENQNLFVLNSTESVVLLSHKMYFFNKTSISSTVVNNIRYKGEIVNTLLDTDLKISDNELTEAIYNSLNTEDIFSDIELISNTTFEAETDSNTKEFSIEFNVEKSADLQQGCVVDKILYWRSVIKGIVCKIGFISGIRYNVKCGAVKLYFMRLNENKNLDANIICKK